MGGMKQWLLYVFLIVISDPYQGLDYNKINVYNVNYCSDYCYNQNVHYSDYFEDDEPEEIEDEWEDDIKDQYSREEDKPLIFGLDFWKPKK